MNPATLADAYAEVARRHVGLPEMTPGWLAAQPAQSLDPPGAWETLKTLKPVEGWLQFQSCVTCFDQGRMPEPEPQWGFLLAAEAVDAESRSCLIRQDGTGGLLLIVATSGASEGAEELLTDEVFQLATGKAPGRLHYRRYWCRDPEMGFVPCFAAFLGFARTEDC